MLTFLRTSLFDSPAQTLVNTVNTVGVMGKGIAKEFKAKYPDMFDAYKQLCDSKRLDIGKLHLWRAPDHWVLNFPTKTTWKFPSKLSYIEDGLRTFVSTYKELGISSISFPPLGCGNGNLNWKDVRPVMVEHLARLPIPIYIHERHVDTKFVPEHMEGLLQVRAPASFSDFLQDIQRTEGRFKTTESNEPFLVRIDDNGNIIAHKSGRDVKVPVELIEHVWGTLQIGPVTSDAFSSENERKSKSYLFPVLSSLPYLKLANSARNENGVNKRGHSLFLVRSTERRPVEISDEDRQKSQLCLSL
jgi:O-acetyl-ADP-ribose deacetylase (regulator of RNase III)